jgi:hypothetical protein
MSPNAQHQLRREGGLGKRTGRQGSDDTCEELKH